MYKGRQPVPRRLPSFHPRAALLRFHRQPKESRTLFRRLFQKRAAAPATERDLPLEVIGLCRFSYPAIGGFQTQHETPRERAQYLYHPDRLEERFRTFEAITLPSLRAQSDQDFTFVVVIGTDFPQRARLQGLLRDLPQAVVQAHPPGQHRDVMTQAINAVRQRRYRFSLQFRLDDDDGLGVRFVELLRRTVRNALPIFASNRRMAVDFTRGHVISATSDGIRALRVTRAYWTPALGVVLRRDCQQSVMSFGHHVLWQHMPTLTLTHPHMFLRGINAHNDSGFRIDKDLTLLSRNEERAFREAYGIDPDRVRHLFADFGQSGSREGE